MRKERSPSTPKKYNQFKKHCMNCYTPINWKSRRNGFKSGNPQTTKTGTGRNRKPEQANNQGGN